MKLILENTNLDTYNTFSTVLNTDNFVRLIDAPLKLKSINHNSEIFNEVGSKPPLKYGPTGET